MRDVKLRGKHILDGTWIYGTGVTDFLNIYYKKDNRIFIWSLDYRWVEIDPKTLSKFTGLLDKQSIEIYEGDIVEHTYIGKNIKYISKIIFNIPQYRYGISRVYSDDENSSNLLFYLTPKNVRKVEVIGNIYENPELLK